MVKSGSCQDHGVVVGPLRGVAPPRPGSVPVVAPRWVADDTLRKALPHDESKVHLCGGEEMNDRNTANQVQRWIYMIKKKQNREEEDEEGTGGKEKNVSFEYFA